MTSYIAICDSFSILQTHTLSCVMQILKLFSRRIVLKDTSMNLQELNCFKHIKVIADGNFSLCNCLTLHLSTHILSFMIQILKYIPGDKRILFSRNEIYIEIKHIPYRCIVRSSRRCPRLLRRQRFDYIVHALV